MSDIYSTSDKIAQVQWLLACFIAYPSSENHEAIALALADYQNYWLGEETRLMGSAHDE